VDPSTMIKRWGRGSKYSDPREALPLAGEGAEEGDSLPVGAWIQVDK